MGSLFGSGVMGPRDHGAQGSGLRALRAWGLGYDPLSGLSWAPHPSIILGTPTTESRLGPSSWRRPPIMPFSALASAGGPSIDPGRLFCGPKASNGLTHSATSPAKAPHTHPRHCEEGRSSFFFCFFARGWLGRCVPCGAGEVRLKKGKGVGLLRGPFQSQKLAGAFCRPNLSRSLWGLFKASLRLLALLLRAPALRPRRLLLVLRTCCALSPQTKTNEET